MAGSRSESSWRAGVRAGSTLALATAVLGVSFGAFATGAGLSAPVAILMSALVLSGSAQFAFVTAMSGGAGPADRAGRGWPDEPPVRSHGRGELAQPARGTAAASLRGTDGG